jgi:hypothetical protein
MSDETIPKGTRVRYIGSISDYTGREGEYVGSHPCYSGSGEIKHTLWFGPGFQDGVQNIRRESFTILEDERPSQPKRTATKIPKL